MQCYLDTQIEENDGVYTVTCNCMYYSRGFAAWIIEKEFNTLDEVMQYIKDALIRVNAENAEALAENY